MEGADEVVGDAEGLTFFGGSLEWVVAGWMTLVLLSPRLLEMTASWSLFRTSKARFVHPKRLSPTWRQVGLLACSYCPARHGSAGGLRQRLPPLRRGGRQAALTNL